MELIKGKKLGSFEIGWTLHEIIDELKYNSRDFKQIKLTYNLFNETNDDIILNVQTCGIYLHFDGIQQRLKLIDVYDLNKISIYYDKLLLTESTLNTKSKINSISDDEFDDIQDDVSDHGNNNNDINNNNNKNTFRQIYNVMGPTYPGYYDKNKCLYYVEYPGLWLAFELKYDPGNSELPVELDDGTSPLLKRLIVYYGDNIINSSLPPLIKTKIYYEPVYIYLNEGIQLGWRKRFVYFGSNVQDVLTDIGPPHTINYKYKSYNNGKNIFSNINNNNNSNNNINYENKYDTNDIHLHNLQKLYNNKKIHSNDYFFNYTVLGMDILFDGVTHCVKKFIFHTNQVSHPDFNRWNKCNFKIIKKGNFNNDYINSNSKWDDVLNIFGSPKGNPIMFKSTHGKLFNNNNNKITNSSIKIYAYQSILFEILPNNSIATLILFHDSTKKSNGSIHHNSSTALDLLDENSTTPSIPQSSNISKKPKSPNNKSTSSINANSSGNPLYPRSPLSESILEATQTNIQDNNTPKKVKSNNNNNGNISKSKSKPKNMDINKVIEITTNNNTIMNNNNNNNNNNKRKMKKSESYSNESSNNDTFDVIPM